MDAAESIVATLSLEQRLAAASNIHTDHVDIHNNAEDAPFGREAAAGETDRQKHSRIADGFGQFLLAVRGAATQPGAIDPRLQKRAALGASEAAPSDGGFLVGTDQSQEILQEMHDVGVLAPRCTEIPISNNSNGIEINGVNETSRVNGSRWGGVLAYWANEAGTVTATKPTFRKVMLKLSKLFALYYATDEVIADAAVLGTLASKAFGEEMAFKVDDAIFEGTGSGQPIGIIGHPSVVSVAKETGQAAATFVYDNAVKMRARMMPRARKNAAWFINVDVEPQLYTMSQAVGTGGSSVVSGVGPNGVSVYVPPGNNGNQYGMLLGAPVIPIEFCPTLGTVGDVVLADMSQYLLATKGGLQQAESMHVAFLTSEMTYRFTYRVDGQPARALPLTPFKGSNTQSPFITLVTR